MASVIPLYKHLGESPLDAIRAFQKSNQKYKTAKLGYAGRLDPMAEGVLLVLVDDENSKRKMYEQLEKEYTFEVLFGMQTDTYDILGKIVQTSDTKEVTPEEIEKLLPLYTGTFKQPYPPYSSPRVKGHPLFWWARENRLSEIIIPTKDVTVYSLVLTNVKKIPLRELHTTIETKLATVSGEFRQEEIKEGWRSFFNTAKVTTCSIATFTISCSSGTYVRSLAHAIGQQLKTGALAYSITRTRVGPYKLDDITSRLSK